MKKVEAKNVHVWQKNDKFFFCHHQKKNINKRPRGVCKNHLMEHPSAF
jgi:hypothetical protein